MSLSGILSLPWSLFSSLPPDVEVPLPLRFDPVVRDSGQLRSRGKCTGVPNWYPDVFRAKA